MKTLLLIAGVLAVIVGTFWALQGAGIVQWPASSFMIANDSWALYGTTLAIVGIGMVWASRR
jgi:hypothetical protein